MPSLVFADARTGEEYGFIGKSVLRGTLYRLNLITRGTASKCESRLRMAKLGSRASAAMQMSLEGMESPVSRNAPSIAP
jgi:hypothetical protein